MCVGGGGATEWLLSFRLTGMNRTGQLVALLIPLAVMSMGTSKNKADGEAGVAGDPLAGDGAKLVGEWSGAGAIMHIGADRSFRYEKKTGGIEKKYEGSLKEVQPGKLVINALLDVTLAVQKMPVDVDGYTTMTVEGIDMYRGGLPGNIAALITQKFKAEGFKKTDCPATANADTSSFECTATVTNTDPVTDAGTDKAIKVLVTRKDLHGDYDFRIESPGLIAQKLADGIPKVLGPYTITSPNCGASSTVWVDIGGTFECTAVDGKTKKNLKVVITRKDADNFHFEATPR